MQYGSVRKVLYYYSVACGIARMDFTPIGPTIKEIPLDVFFLKQRQKLCFISFIKKELLTKFDEIHYTSTNGSEKPSLAVSNNSNVLPPQ